MNKLLMNVVAIGFLAPAMAFSATKTAQLTEAPYSPKVQKILKSTAAKYFTERLQKIAEAEQKKKRDGVSVKWQDNVIIAEGAGNTIEISASDVWTHAMRINGRTFSWDHRESNDKNLTRYAALFHADSKTSFLHMLHEMAAPVSLSYAQEVVVSEAEQESLSKYRLYGPRGGAYIVASQAQWRKEYGKSRIFQIGDAGLALYFSVREDIPFPEVMGALYKKVNRLLYACKSEQPDDLAGTFEDQTVENAQDMIDSDFSDYNRRLVITSCRDVRRHFLSDRRVSGADKLTAKRLCKDIESLEVCASKRQKVRDAALNGALQNKRVDHDGPSMPNKASSSAAHGASAK